MPTLQNPRVTLQPSEQPRRPWCRIGAVLLACLALTIAACGSTTGGGAQATPTPKPTITPTPAPCTGWRIVASPNDARHAASVLYAVTALSPTAAWAGGLANSVNDTSFSADSLIEKWDGSAWQIVANSGHDAILGMTAISPTDVWAVGGQIAGPITRTSAFTMHWDGTAWSVVPSAQSAGAAITSQVTWYAVQFNGVAAITSHDVWAVGQQHVGTDPQVVPQPLIERWDGSAWYLASIPLPTAPQGTPIGGTLNAVTHIPGTNQLWAVGGSKLGVSMGPAQPLIERWDGTAWQIVASPSLPTDALGGIWNGIVALSATNAWAVGSYALSNPMDSHPMIGHWDGAKWTLATSPDAFGELDSVVAAGATDVRAVGSQLTGSGAGSGNGVRSSIIEQWNGTSWQIVTLPKPSGALPEPSLASTSLGIAADGASNYWVVGSYGVSAGVTHTLTLHCP